FAADRYDMDVRLVVDAHSGRVVSARPVAGEPYGPPYQGPGFPGYPRYQGYPGYQGYGVVPRGAPPGYASPYPVERPPYPVERPWRFDGRAPLLPPDASIYGSGHAFGAVPIEEGAFRLATPARGRATAESLRRTATASAARPPLP